jgi:catechol 2,3-dioxygenase-like lactoylglutathione lyase family enzyme
MTLSVREIKPYVPAKDFELSQRFYTALGFKLTEAFGDTVDCDLNGNRFRLQNFYVKDWANNSMLLIDVDDIEAWQEHLKDMDASGEFRGMRVSPTEEISGSQVLHVVDPSGVLLIFIQ